MIILTRLVPVLAVFALLAPIARAEPAEEVKALVAELAAGSKAKDNAALGDSLKKVVDLYGSIEEKALRSKLIGAVGKVLKNKRLGDARLAAVDTLVAVNDGKAAWKALSRQMPNPKKVEEATELHLAVVKAAGKLAQPRAIKPLTEMAYKCKINALAAAAALSLGGYKDDKKNRVSILVELMDIGKRTRPGRSLTRRVSPVARERWQVVGRAVITALNELTGRTERDFESWEELVKTTGKKPKVLFED